MNGHGEFDYTWHRPAGFARGGAPPAPRLKPEEMDPALVSALVEHRVGLPPDGIDTLTKPITYILAANGVFEVRRNRIGLSARCVVEIKTPIMGLTEQLQEGYLPLIPKLPFDLFQQIVVFFRDVNDAYHAEAYVQCWWDFDVQRYALHVPLQDISGGMVHHDGDMDKDLTGNKVHAIDIHSHNTMGAFFSSTDDGDEARYERMYGVVGQIDKMIPATKWRARTTGKFLDLTMEEVVELPTYKVEWKSDTFSMPIGELLKTPGANPTVTFPKGSILDPFAGVIYPKSEWWEMLITDVKDKRRKPDLEVSARGSFQTAQSFGPSGPISEGLSRSTEHLTDLLVNPMSLAVCTRFRTMGRPRLALRHFADTHPSGYAVFYVIGPRVERAPFAEERAILGGLPQAGFSPEFPRGY